MSTAPLSTVDVANRLVALCRQGKNHEAMDTLYADDVVSVEAGAAPGQDATVTGLAAVKAKGQWWVENHEVHSAEVGGPWPNGDQFITTFKYDVTFKPQGKRFTMEEGALFTVRDGKIVKEVFFYAVG